MSSYDVISDGKKDSKWLPQVWLILFIALFFIKKATTKTRVWDAHCKEMQKNDNTIK